MQRVCSDWHGYQFWNLLVQRHPFHTSWSKDTDVESTAFYHSSNTFRLVFAFSLRNGVSVLCIRTPQEKTRLRRILPIVRRTSHTLSHTWEITLISWVISKIAILNCSWILCKRSMICAWMSHLKRLSVHRQSSNQALGPLSQSSLVVTGELMRIFFHCCAGYGSWTNVSHSIHFSKTIAFFQFGWRMATASWACSPTVNNGFKEASASWKIKEIPMTSDFLSVLFFGICRNLFWLKKDFLKTLLLE